MFGNRECLPSTSLHVDNVTANTDQLRDQSRTQLIAKRIDERKGRRRPAAMASTLLKLESTKVVSLAGPNGTFGGGAEKGTFMTRESNAVEIKRTSPS